MVIEDLVLLLRAATDSFKRMCVSESLVRLLVVNGRCVIFVKICYVLASTSKLHGHPIECNSDAFECCTHARLNGLLGHELSIVDDVTSNKGFIEPSCSS